MGKTNRREFLKASALGAMTAFPAVVAAAEVKRPGEITSWVTNENMRFQRQDPLQWHPASRRTVDNVISLHPEIKFQEILGFGAAFTDAACFTFNRLTASTRQQLFRELFHPSEINLNVCRTCIGASDYSSKVYSYDEGDADIDLKRFSIDHDREYILPILREARNANRDLFLFSSPWSPPGWMKSGGSMLGGSMSRRYLPVYAQYFLKFLRAYADAGVPVQAITVQNEVDTDQDGRMPACIWAQEYEIEFVGKQLGPLLASRGLSTKIWILDHNYNLWGRAVAELDDSDVRKFCNAIAWHGYAGTPEMMTRTHEFHPDAEMYWTEGGPDYTSPGYLTDWVTWGKTFIDVLRNWSRSVTAWNLALDEKGNPNIGPFSCGGLVTIHSQTREITRSGQYWALAHFSGSIRRGAHRFDSVNTIPGISHAAFANPDGTHVLVMANAGRAANIKVDLGNQQAEINLDKNSVTTYIWSS